MDREKVIKSLKWFRDRDSWREGIMIHDDHAEVRKRICDDALALLKEQEPIMIKTTMINGSGRNGRCQNCLMMLNEMDYPNYCGNCGKELKWE